MAIDAEALLQGFALAHQARDWGKLAFSVELSRGLEGLSAMAQHRGSSRDCLSWLHLTDLSESLVQRWGAMEQNRRARYAREARIRMPLLLDRHTDLRRVITAPGRPAYLGYGRVLAPVISIHAHSQPSALLEGSVLILERCEPGFDWVFRHRPAAIVTAYGGPNAHVALRAHEMDCPALLGVGPEAIARICAHAGIEIDFDQKWWRSANAPTMEKIA